jgi:exopolysaccharide biosynthesis polyprenyl glycosylphosphotransferase
VEKGCAQGDLGGLEGNGTHAHGGPNGALDFDPAIASGSSLKGVPTRSAGAAAEQPQWQVRQRRPGARSWISRRGLMAADALAISIGLILDSLVFPSADHHVGQLAMRLTFLPMTTILAGALGLYSRDRELADQSTPEDVAGIVHAVTLASWIPLAAGALFWNVDDNRIRAVAFLWAATIPSMITLRAAARTLRGHGHACLQKTVIVGAGEIGQMVADKLLRNPQFCCQLIGFVDAQPRERPPSLAAVPLLGGVDRLGETVREHDVDRVIIAFTADSQRKTVELLRWLARDRVHVDVVPRLFEALGPRASMRSLEGLPLVSLPDQFQSRLGSALKRVIDVVGAAAALLVIWPVMLLIAICIKRDSPGPVLYRSDRIGRDGRRFEMCKFRTMRSEYCRGSRYASESAEAQFMEVMSDPALRSEFARTHKLRHDPRVTRMGAMLRRWYLDELPQLWNVLRRDMSLVGPRAVTVEEVLGGEIERHDATLGIGSQESLPPVPPYWEMPGLRPGLTGYWQIMGGSRVGYEERLRLDLLYASDWSLKLDLLIIARTLAVVARHATS